MAGKRVPASDQESPVTLDPEGRCFSVRAKPLEGQCAEAKRYPDDAECSATEAGHKNGFPRKEGTGKMEKRKDER